MEKYSMWRKLLAGSALLSTLPLFGPKLVAQDSSAQQASGQAAQSAQDQQQAHTFMGTIGKSHGTLVLKGGYASQDPDARTTYKLTDHEKAKQYVGRNVKVTGTLDTRTNTIHVSHIKGGSS
jgi:Protein of unknown function (DUF5818)